MTVYRALISCTIAGMLSILVSSPSFAAPDNGSVKTDAIAKNLSADSASIPAANAPMHLTFALQSNRQAEVNSFVSSLYNPSSGSYHHWLTPEEYGQKFGASSSNISDVQKFLISKGFSNIKTWSNQLFITADAKRSTVESALNVHIVACARSENDIARGLSPTFYAPDKNPTLDTVTSKCLAGIFGLSNASQRRSHLVHPPKAQADTAILGLTPADLTSIYDSTGLRNQGLYGSGETIAIFSPTAFQASDLTTFFTAAGITNPDINIVDVNGGTTDLSSQDEACLDIETIVGQAPEATVNVYEGPNDGSLDIYQQIAADDPTIVSNSYGADEDQVDAAYAHSYEVLREEMAAEGITIFVASGDNGAYDDVNQTTTTVSVDASSAYVTAVGGTELQSQSPFVWDGEVAWTYNDGTLNPNSGSGGGLSIYYRQPSWQTGLGVRNVYSDGFRQIPDVSAVASSPYYIIYTAGSYEDVGGTSASAAFWAGSFAAVDEAVGGRIGNIGPELYQIAADDPAVYHDIISGDNGAYPCTPNWDFVTGWGSADFGLLTAAIEADFSTSTTTPVHLFGPGLQMFSIPFEYSANNSISNILNGLVTTSGSPTSTIAAWLPLSGAYALTPVAPSNLPVPGQGYWGRFDSSGGGTLALRGNPVTSSTYSIPISAGWNMIGDPYLVSVPFNALQLSTSAGTITISTAINQGLISPIYFDYNGTNYNEYGPGDSINSYDGYWLRSFVDGTLIFTSP